MIIFAVAACGDPSETTNNSSNNGEPTCSTFGEEGDTYHVCTLRSPIQETGFLCPEGAPYLFEVEAAAVCSENPDLRESQRTEIRDGGVEDCENSSSSFCKAVTADTLRLQNCDEWISLTDLCLSDEEKTEIDTACRDAATGAANEDWIRLADCFETSNGFGGGDPDEEAMFMCQSHAGCIGRALRVCHTFNDECWNIRTGRGGVCDNFLGQTMGCSTETELATLTMRCENAVNTATDVEWAELEECFVASNSGQCESHRDCAALVLANF